MEGIDSIHPEEASTKSLLESLPPELRDLIYEFTRIVDLEAFIDKGTKPGLLNTSQQLRKEYINVFFANPALSIDAYSGPGNGWRSIKNPESQCVIFETGTFVSSVNFWSLGSTRRYCQREYSNFQGNIENGIMTIKMWQSTGIHRWQWSRALTDMSDEERRQPYVKRFSWLTPEQLDSLCNSKGRSVAHQMLRSSRTWLPPPPPSANTSGMFSSTASDVEHRINPLRAPRPQSNSSI